MKHLCSFFALLILRADAFSTPTAPAAQQGAATTKQKSRVQRVIESTGTETQSGGAGASTTYEAFVRAEENWTRLKQAKGFRYDPKLLSQPPPPTFITDDGSQGSAQCWQALREGKKLDYDVVICGGTLGIFFATALALRQGGDVKICVVEAGKLQGRVQEWNISRKELEELVEMGVMTTEEVEQVIRTEFQGCRSG